ncbi:uncharacterized protein LOC127846339 [Dreissena polymorpha]|uniref:uncharacterized protein LOC127846339 n=1 Tax=Dreissena polymorpha TaxID=45954 RepID=UPI002263BF2C|nr:uncharacterized protein LOC127846339 [Dreissena polymorpha]
MCNNLNTQKHRKEPEVLPTRPEFHRVERRLEITVLHSSSQRHKQGVLLKTAISSVYFGQIHTNACILFDEGAHNSFITEALARELEVKRTGTDTIQLAAFGDKKDWILHLKTATINLISDRKECIPINVLIVPTIATPISTRLQHTAALLPYISKLKLAHPVTARENFRISLLIGADHYWDIIEDEVIRGKGPTAVKSKIGYVLSGPVGADEKKSNHVLNVITSRANKASSLERSLFLENLVIIPPTDVSEKLDNLNTYQQTSIDYSVNQYTASLPWENDHEPLPFQLLRS